MDLDSTRTNFSMDLSNVQTNIESMMKEPDHAHIEKVQGLIKNILENKEYNEIQDIRKAFDALHTLDNELTSLDGVFTYGGGSISPGDLNTISNLMKETLNVIPAPPSQAILAEETTQSLLQQSREAIRKHDYEAAAGFLRRLPDPNERAQKLEGLVRSMIDQRENMVKIGEKKTLQEATQRCFEMNKYFQNPAVRNAVMTDFFYKLVKEEDPDTNFLMKFYDFFPTGSKIQVLTEILKLKITDEEYDDIVKAGPPNEPPSDLFGRVYIYTLQREGKLDY